LRGVSLLVQSYGKVFLVSLVRGCSAGMENTIVTLGGAVVYSVHTACEVDRCPLYQVLEFPSLFLSARSKMCVESSV
jgi:hypothetical protein